MGMIIEEMPRDFHYSMSFHALPAQYSTPSQFDTFPSSNLKSDCTIEFPVLKVSLVYYSLVTILSQDLPTTREEEIGVSSCETTTSMHVRNRSPETPQTCRSPDLPYKHTHPIHTHTRQPQEAHRACS
jgi:hypothetical protein